MRVQVKGILFLLLLFFQPQNIITQDTFTESEKEELQKSAETHEFQAEVNRLMDIIINSLYTQKEIFLRELISNASDALDKIRFMSVKNPDILGEQTELQIKVDYDSNEKSLSITDTGVGMTKQEIIQNLGTIAKSGTTNFIEAIKGGNINLIGQFGVGFYSSFLAGQKVTVITKSNDDPNQYIWESSAANQFTIVVDPRGPTLKRGTKVTIHLKQDSHEFCEESKIKELIKKYSEFINFPIYLKTIKDVTKEVPIEESEEEDLEKKSQTEDEKKDEDVEIKDGEEKKEEKPKTKTVTEKVVDWVLQNDNKAIWLRNKEEIEDEDYKKFYKSFSKASQNDDPMTWIHFKAEGEVEFTSLIYIPLRAPYDSFENYYGKSANLKLYVRRVLINEEFEDLIPKYLNFVKGVIDSDELPLNVNRESLQQLKMLKVMGKKVVRKTLEMIKKLADPTDDDEEDSDDEKTDKDSKKDIEKEEEQDEEAVQAEKEKKRKEKEAKYQQFWTEFGKHIKLGIIEDASNRQKLAKLSRWYSSKNTSELISLDTYIQRQDSKQDKIFFLAGEKRDQLMKSPMIQGFLKKDIEVLLLDDPVDEFCMQHLTEYEKKKFVNIAKGDFKMPGEEDLERKRNKKLKKMYNPLTEWWQKLLSEQIESVRVSSRLVDDPCAVVSSEYGYSATMERIQKAQAYGSQKESPYANTKKILEINPSHPAIKELLERVKDNPDAETEELGRVLYEAASINSGYILPNTVDFSKRFYRLFNGALGIPKDAQVEEVEVVLDEEDEEKKPEGDNKRDEDLDDLKPNEDKSSEFKPQGGDNNEF